MSGGTLDIIPPETARTLSGLFRERVRRSPTAAAYRYFDVDRNVWLEIPWQEAADIVARMQAALAQEALEPGDRVAIMLRNCPQWVLFEQAVLGMGLILVPLYTDDHADNIAYVLQDAGARLLLLEGEAQLVALESVRLQLQGLIRLLTVQPVEQDRGYRQTCLDEWMAVDSGELQAKEADDPDALATIVYTSGTTGHPKGVMLSHHNILFDAYASSQNIATYREDLFLSFLPLCHMLERTGGYYIPMMAGATVAFARSVPQLAEDLLSVRPTAMISVPRIYERVYGKIITQLAAKPPIARKLFHWAVTVGWSRFLYRQGRAPWRLSQVFWPLLKYLVADKIMSRLGGRLRVAICGGAPLSPDVARIFIGLGLNLSLGYGLTETSPVISVSPLEDNDPACAGLALKGVEVSLGEGDELLTRSPAVMLGYWHNAEATAEVIDNQGWLHTGDVARIDEHGHIYITGRLKEIIVLSTGMKVPPSDMELAITLDPLFEQAMVVGEGRPFLGVLVVPEPEQWAVLLKQLGLSADDPGLLQDTSLLKATLDRVITRLKMFPGDAPIHRIALCLDPWTIKNGLITPTLKLRRSRVEERFGKEIEAFYIGH